MKKWYYILFFILIVAILSGCEEKEQTYTDDYNKLTDYQIEYDAFESRVTASDKGYYFLNGHVIYYMDQDGDKPVILDSRPDNECLSTTNFTNCNAFVSLTSEEITLFQFYEDKLYTIEFKELDQDEYNPDNPFVFGEYELVSRNPNGEGRKVHHTFPNAEIRKASIHRDYIYYTVDDYEIDDDNGEIESHFSLLRLPLAKLSAEPEIIFAAEEGQISSFTPYGSQVYISYSPDNPAVMDSYKRYDLNSKEIDDLWDAWDDAYPTLLNIYEDKMYFKYVKQSTSDDITYLLDEKYITIHSSNLDGSEAEETNIPIAEVTSVPYFDENYTYVVPSDLDIEILSDWADIEIEDNDMKVYEDDELIETISFPDHLTLSHSFYPGDKQFMFIHNTADDMSHFYYVDKREIANGNVTFELFIETPRMFDEVNNPPLE